MTEAFATRTCFHAPEVWQKSKGMKYVAILFSLILYYYDFATDIEVVVDLFAASNRGMGSQLTTYAAWLSVAILLMTPMVIFGVDCAYEFEERSSKNENGPLWQRLLLSFMVNFTNTKPLYVTATSFFDGMFVEADQAVTGIKFLEVLLEALPEMFLQSAIFAASLVDTRTIVRSLASSVANTAWTCTSRALQMYGSSVLDFTKTFKATIAIFMYILCDVMSRASAMFVRVAIHGMNAESVVWWLLVWFCLEMLVRKGTVFLGGKKKGHRAKSWVVDDSTLSALAGILSALPLTRNPTERRWLFVMSIVFPVGAVTSSISHDDIMSNSREGQAATVFIAAVVLKICIYFVGEIFVMPGFDRGYDGADPHGRGAFALSKYTDSARNKFQWVAWYEQETRNGDQPRALEWNHCKGFGETRNRYEGLVAWVEKHREKDAFDRHLIKSGSESCWTCRWTVGDEIQVERAAGRIEKRRTRRMLFQELNACGALVNFPSSESSRRISDVLPDLPGLKTLKYYPSILQ